MSIIPAMTAIGIATRSTGRGATGGGGVRRPLTDPDNLVVHVHESTNEMFRWHWHVYNAEDWERIKGAPCQISESVEWGLAMTKWGARSRAREVCRIRTADKSETYRWTREP